MDIDEFRKQAHRMVDWMADYMAGIESYPVRAQVKPGEIAAKLPDGPPAESESMDLIFEDFQRDIVPGVTHWQHPSFFAYFTANSSPPSVLAEMLTATLGAQCMLWQTSPAATEMETKVLDWLRQMTGLGEGFHGVIQDSASSAILCAILTAREQATGWQGNKAGLKNVPKLTAYTSGETHSATEKGIKIAGMGSDNLRKLPVDENFAVIPEELERMIVEDKKAGMVPAIVVASIGATGVGAIDPLRAIGEICAKHGVFLHVDAAWAGSAWILPETRWMMDGMEYADSVVFNPHKWMFTNFDCSAHYVRDPDALVHTLTILPEFLKSREQGQVIDYRDWSVPLGRRFRALKLWFVIRSYGVEGLQEMIRAHIGYAEELEGWIEAAEDFELVAPRVLALTTFRYHPKGVDDEAELDRFNEDLITKLNDSGKLYLTQTRVRGKYAIRFNIGQTWTERRHVEAAWQIIQETAAGL
ncbi:aspartate aminotransferase family protein [Hwanghaeella grinnelliae]|uniref:Aspartate aminotransferase family protein n=1 Tax=Hwanghaeella grinnelliae TaxID=2500179 RepID=A0A437QV82_9PROT|nr:pyridoxal-dependent decarboxylase [Hwanghaeella grinnelliae]RVU38430.1 aspartate aminotransferase family protein [Hwanghaeella grinnelliae]